MKLTPRHQVIAKLLLAGHNQAEIARQLGLNRSSICRAMKSPRLAHELARLQRERLNNGVRLSLDVLVEILEDTRKDTKTMRLKLMAAKDVLDRAGYAPVKQVQSFQASAHLTREEVEEIKLRARMAGSDQVLMA